MYRATFHIILAALVLPFVAPAVAHSEEPSVDAAEHWAFAPITSPAIPEVRHPDWPVTPVDHFILRKIEATGLVPSPEADRRTLIRRLSYDLIGLPPTPEEVAAFIADESSDAYEKLVERLLSSPHYGERWARHWLDVARYADTKGYVYGREEVAFTHSHAYRDWAIDSINRDRPYDEFVRLQLAADSFVSDDERADLAAMGFLTLGQRYLGVMADIIDDRIDTVTRGLMGLTVSCARCHDHKFDAVPIEDYYSLYGVFSASSERLHELTPAEHDRDAYAEFDEEMAKRKQKLEETFQAKVIEVEGRLRSQVDRYLSAVPNVHTYPTDEFYEIRNPEDLNPTIIRRWATYIEQCGDVDPVFGIWNRLAEVPAESFAAEVQSILENSDAPQINPFLHAALTRSAPESIQALADAYAVVFRHVEKEWRTAVESAKESEADPPNQLSEPDREAIRQHMFKDDSPIRVPEGAIVDLEWMFDEDVRVELATLQAEIDRWIINAPTAPKFAVTLEDKPDPTPPQVFLRGDPANPGEEVPRQFLALIEGDDREQFDHGSGRRDLALAITDPENPLTARVMVNRIWMWHFGSPLVATPSDFGTRAAEPTHPELLDWLAREFIDSGWSMKHMHRQIVLSAAYRQQSAFDETTRHGAHAAKIDPENTLLWRFNRRRLSFGEMRDALLATAGTLDQTMGGRAVDITAQPFSARRTIYGKVDRRYLPAVFRVFDFPNPDMHSPQRSNTTVPQQSLFLMNNAFAETQARALAARIESEADTHARIDKLYLATYQRPAAQSELDRAVEFIGNAGKVTPPSPEPPPPSPWSYGYGRFDSETGKVASFTPLPHFTGEAWQGGPEWPDATLGWAQLTAMGGHPGNDLDHAVIRRWTSPLDGFVTIEGRVEHKRTEGDGIMLRVISSRQGVLGAWHVHNSDADTNFSGIPVEAGDTIDFEVDIKEVLNSDEYHWAPVLSIEGEEVAQRWDAEKEFAGPPDPLPEPLTPWQKLAHVLLISNEFLYID